MKTNFFIVVIGLVLLVMILMPVDKFGGGPIAGYPVMAVAPAKPTPTPISPGCRVIHLVVFGENLTRIAAKYGSTVEALVKANNLPNPNQIREGQRLCIP